MKPEAWGGVECTICRVGDRYMDQCARNGHVVRIDDLDRFADLGLKTLRHPFLWEQAAGEEEGAYDWRWCDARMGRLRTLGIRPIAGLLHHGSGPRFTSLLDPDFPKKFARYAGAFAARYPDVDRYTPINEPLTTARFSGLYRVWYPHASDDRSFVAALRNQIRGIVLAMREIRRHQPNARLVQTEDLGRTRSTPEVAGQAAFENERRWLSLDLLCGRVDRSHALREYLEASGFTDLEWHRANACPPAIVGMNHYLLSNRWLDHRLDRFPRASRGGNGRLAYADVGAVHVADVPLIASGDVLQEAWSRYGLPMAITEVHIDGARETQMRWFAEAVETGRRLRREGVDLVAVTAWSLLGTYDWNSLCVRDDGYYESGVFDLRGGWPRPTALAHLVSSFALGERVDHPVLDGEGWWRTRNGPAQSPPSPTRIVRKREVLIVGKNGTLGGAFARICEERGLAFRAVGRAEMDIGDPASVRRVLDQVRPWAVINAAGYVRVDLAEREPDRCHRENVEGPMHLAEACVGTGIQLLSFSSDLVFDGQTETPYDELSRPAPLNAYGRSKLEAERLVLSTLESALVIRSSFFFGPWDEHNAVTQALRAIRSGNVATAASDMVVSPTYVPDLVRAALDFLIDGERGLLHVSNSGQISWADLVKRAAVRAHLDPGRVHGVPLAQMGFAARRPRYSAMVSGRGARLPDLDDAIDRFLRDLSPAMQAELTA